MRLNRLKALNLLSECTGDDIWSLDHCRQRSVPQAWLEELADCFESGFNHDRQTIYVDDSMVNQYQGIRDVDLAIKLGEYLGVNTSRYTCQAMSRAQIVSAIREEIMDG